MLSSPVARGAVVAGAFALTACGSSSTGSLFSNGAASGGTAEASISSGGSISAGGAPAASGGASASSTGGVGGAQVDGGGGVQGGGVPGNGGLGTAGGSGGVQSAGGFGFGGVAAGGVGGRAGAAGATSNGGRGGVPSGEVACERASCSTAANEHCCFGDTFAAHCYGGSSGGQCSCGIFCTTVDVECDGPEDCSEGRHCCGEMSLTDGIYTHLYCQTSCDSGITTTLTEICHLGSNTCSNGNPCSNDGLVPAGYGDCG